MSDYISGASLVAQMVKNLPPVQETWVQSLSWEHPLEKEMQPTPVWHPTPVLLPGKSHGWRSLGGCSPWGRTESDTTEATQQQQQQPVFLPGKFHQQRKLAGYSPWGQKESDLTE